MSNRVTGVGAVTLLVYVGVLLGLLVGWVMNIIALFHTLDGGLTALFVARLVGTVVFPLGGVLGYF